MTDLELREGVRKALAEAEAQRDDAGRGNRGRCLALAATKLEEAFFWLRAAGEAVG